MTPKDFDLVNSVTEIICSIVMWANVVAIYRQKKVSGVHWAATGIFFLEYCWNVFYYIGLNQFYSIFAGINIVISNFIWILLAIKYRANK